jgi:hypothetical protein
VRETLYTSGRNERCCCSCSCCDTNPPPSSSSSSSTQLFQQLLLSISFGNAFSSWQQQMERRHEHAEANHRWFSNVVGLVQVDSPRPIAERRLVPIVVSTSCTKQVKNRFPKFGFSNPTCVPLQRGLRRVPPRPSPADGASCLRRAGTPAGPAGPRRRARGGAPGGGCTSCIQLTHIHSSVLPIE